jgi:hypothetical protein
VFLLLFVPTILLGAGIVHLGFYRLSAQLDSIAKELGYRDTRPGFRVSRLMKANTHITSLIALVICVGGRHFDTWFVSSLTKAR